MRGMQEEAGRNQAKTQFLEKSRLHQTPQGALEYEQYLKGCSPIPDIPQGGSRRLKAIHGRKVQL